MIIIKLMGGLGNQLQQYALYQKYISLGRDAYLDTSWFDADVQAGKLAPRAIELDLFEKADYRTATREQVAQILGPQNFMAKVMRKLHMLPAHYFGEKDMYHPEIFEMDNVYLEGYWAAEKYYEDILPVLCEKLKFENINEANQNAAEEITQCSAKNQPEKPENSHAYSCAVHIRRGDYLDPVNAEMFGGIATEAYYDAALEYVRDKHPGTTFFIFSDDPEYVKEKYGQDSNCRFVDINHGSDSRYDIYLMSLCDGHICANSTFSFWGARLDSKRVENSHSTGTDIKDNTSNTILIRPYIHKNSQVFIPEEMHDLWRDWILIDKKGRIC